VKERQPVLFRIKTNILIFHISPQPLYEDVVGGSALAVHLDPDICFLHGLLLQGAGELAALVGVDDIGCSIQYLSMMSMIIRFSVLSPLGVK
jgi:hypothetical protein